MVSFNRKMDKIKKRFAIASIVAALGFCGMLLLKAPFLGLDSPEFCGSCHAMDEQLGTYEHSAHRLGASCGDCHIPHSLVYGAAFKAWTGTRDVLAVTANTVPVDMRTTEMSKEVLQENCLRCHGDVMGEVGDTSRDGGKYCFDCHRSSPHQK